MRRHRARGAAAGARHRRNPHGGGSPGAGASCRGSSGSSCGCSGGSPGASAPWWRWCWALPPSTFTQRYRPSPICWTHGRGGRSPCWTATARSLRGGAKPLAARSTPTRCRNTCATPSSPPKTGGSTGMSASARAASPAPSASTCAKGGARWKATADPRSRNRWRNCCVLACPMTPRRGNRKPPMKPTAAAAACGARSRKCPMPSRWRPSIPRTRS